VAEIAKHVNIPIIGTGGVLTGQDAIEMILAGATAVGVGSALWYRGPDVFSIIQEELGAFMKGHNIQSIQDIIGKALQN